MDYALPTWEQGSRGFWTKRKKSATSLVAIMALLAGIAVAFKLFDQTVPNNVVRDASVFNFDVWVARTSSQGCTSTATPQWCNTLDPANPNPIFPSDNVSPTGTRPASVFPGDSTTQDVRITNTNTSPAKDASFEVYIQNITVERCSDFDASGGTSSGDFDPETGACLGTVEAVPAGTDFNRFVNFFTLTVNKQQIFFTTVPSRQEYETTEYSEACSGGLKEITKASPCELGLIRANGSTGLQGSELDDRDYEFEIAEQDDGSDQSKFKGWAVRFDFVFQARVPAVSDASGPAGAR